MLQRLKGFLDVEAFHSDAEVIDTGAWGRSAALCVKAKEAASAPELAEVDSLIPNGEAE